MTDVAVSERRGPKNPLMRFLFHHEIPEYPTGARRIGYLALAVVATITLYYTYYTQTGVTPQILQGYHMTFGYYVWIVVISNALGAFASLPASITDRLGRSNVVIYGLLIIGAIIAFWVPNTHSSFSFGLAISVMGIFEGAVLVATPALVRDYSPQMGRATAMGFWTVGPVAGSFIVSIVARNTLDHLKPWQDQFMISGITSIVIFVISLLFLKDLAPVVRDQLMVSEQDKALIQAKARGISEEDLLKAQQSPWRQILSGKLIGSAFGISVFLLVYYIAASFFTIYYVVTFVHPNGLAFSTTDANWLNQWFWGADIVSLIIIGWLSDKILVRKPFMLVGTIAGIIFLIIFLGFATHPSTSRTTLAIYGCLIALALSCTYAPWMANYTEMVEEKNPALVATGLALWGWLLRIVVAVSFIFMPIVIRSVSPIVNNQAVAQTPIPQCNVAPAANGQAAIPGPAVPAGQTAQTFLAAHPDSVAFAQANSALLAKVSANFRVVAGAQAGNAVDIAKVAVIFGADTTKLLALAPQLNKLVVPYACQLNYLAEHQAQLAALQNGLKASPKEWQRWFWVDVAGMVVFLPFIFLADGPWSPKEARRRRDEQEAKVAAELAALGASGS
jgi:MFS family permease